MTMMAEIKVAEDRVADDCIHFTDSIAAAASISGEKPVFCFSASALKHQVSQFLANFPGEVAYAVKANPSDEVIQGAYEAGIRVFDVASTLEMETVTRLCGGSTFHYHNPVKSRAEIATAYHAFGCRRFAADCVEEIGKIARSVGSVAGVELAIRFRLPSGKASVHDFSSKFGVDEFKAAELMQYAVKFGFLPDPDLPSRLSMYRPGCLEEPHSSRRSNCQIGRCEADQIKRRRRVSSPLFRQPWSTSQIVFQCDRRYCYRCFRRQCSRT